MVRPIAMEARSPTLLAASHSADHDEQMPISVFAVNYPRFKAKENKTQALLSALMLTVAGSGLFAASSLTENPSLSWHEFNWFRSWTVMFFCFAMFCFMTATIMSYIFMVLFLTNPKLTTKDAKKGMGPILYRMPKVYFLVGYLSCVGGTTCYFLCMISGHATAGCLVICLLSMVFPVFLALYRASLILPLEEEAPEEASVEARTSTLDERALYPKAW